MRKDRLAVGAANPADDTLTANFVEVGYHDLDPLARERCRTGCANSGRNTRNDRDLVMDLTY
jgi:hypothetical protein